MAAKLMKKILALESMRGISAIAVAFFHFNVGSHFNNNFVSNAWLMVDFFFVLSGFVIALSYMEKLTNFRDILTFQTKRLLRLYPLHLVMLFLFLGIEFSKYIAEANYGIIAKNRAFSENDLSSFIANILLIQNWTLNNLTYNYPSWSISAEFVTYALFATLVIMTKANPIYISVILFCCVLLFGFTLFQTGMGTGSISGGPIRCLYSFSIGTLTCIIYKKIICKFGGFNSQIPLCMTVLSIYIVSTYGNNHFGYVAFIPILFGITILSISLLRNDSLLNKFLTMEWLVYLGTISYGIYMIHYFIWRIIAQILISVMDFPTSIDKGGKFKIIIDDIFIADAILIIGILITIMLAHISHQYFEKKFRFKRFSQGPQIF